MKNPIIPLLAALGLCSISCYRTPVESGLKTVVAELPVRSRQMGITTRATDDEALRDVNWWLCDADDAVILHGFQNDATVRFECIPNTYRLRIAANMGTDLGNAPVWDDLRVSHADDRDVLPMSCDVPLDIPAPAGGVVRLPAVEVERRAAKISCKISVKAPGIELRSVRLCSVPSSVPLFAPDAAPSDNPDDYTDTPVRPLSGRQAAAEFYLLPNEQGTVPEITDQRQKNPDNAPANASCLLIRAVRGGKVLAYMVYLGENNTSDFNVKANRHYRLDITLVDDNTADTRVSAYTAAVEDTFGRTQLGGYCFHAPSNRLTVTLTGDGCAPAVRGRLDVLEGDAAAFRFDGLAGPGHDFALAQGVTQFPISYTPGIYTGTNSRLRYRVRLTDEYGFSQDYVFEHTFMNRLDIHVPKGGSVRAKNPLYIHTEAENEGMRVSMLCLEECRLEAVPEAGYAFGGWYADSGSTQALSAEKAYLFRPAERLCELHVRFLPPVVALDADGTSNCYIAPARNARYSFDAATMGNGQPTKGILPGSLSGTEVRVLWETGAERGAVVRNAEYRDGRICFETGTRHGNALIGLFDAAGNCIWSWHIWAVDFDPEATAQTYASGKTFMSRNLGAETTVPSVAGSKGLYYQWGRKDPFVYPAGTSDRQTAPVRSLEGYEFRVYDRAAPECYTLSWATAHPTAFLTGAPGPSENTWCTFGNDNLWGYSVTDLNGQVISAKSIYDPCPPGWRVPPYGTWETEAFRKASAEGTYGWHMYYEPAGADTAFYPYTGYLAGMEGAFAYRGLREQVQLWTNVPRLATSAQDTRDMAYYLYIPDKGMTGLATTFSDRGMPVRCIRE